MKFGLQRISSVVAASILCFTVLFLMSLTDKTATLPETVSGVNGAARVPTERPPQARPSQSDGDGSGEDNTTPSKNNNKASPVGGGGLPVSSSYQEFFVDLAKEHYGVLLFDAIFEPDAFNAAVTSMTTSSEDQTVIPNDSRYTWDIGKLRLRPVAPECFRTPADILYLSKMLLSVGIGRFHRDKQLALMYLRAASSGNLHLFARQLQRILTAYASYFHTMLQLAIDAMEASTKDELHKLQSKFPHADPLTVIMTRVSHKDKKGVEALLQRPTSIVAEQITAKGYGKTNEKGEASGALPQRQRTTGSIAPMFPLEYNMGHFDSQRPINGKFWNMIRPTVSCSSLVRLCEVPDGCRLLCNAEYIMQAGLARTQTGDAENRPKTNKYFHRIAGFGSNNEYDWETSLHRMFQKSIAHSNGETHEIGWITVFDCTLGFGRREWAPPKELTESSIGFGHVTKCCDREPSDKSVSLGITKALLLKSEQERLAKRSASEARTVGEQVTRYRVAEGAFLPKSPEDSGVRTFDDLTILKLDIEGYEFNVLPKWGRDELRCLAQQRPAVFAPGSSDLIDFAEDCQEYFTVSLLSMEFHRSGHKGDYGARLTGALRAHYTMLHAYSLGYVMVGQEKNHQDNCCYEVAWVHQRHFVRSEMWMLLGDEK